MAQRIDPATYDVLSDEKAADVRADTPTVIDLLIDGKVVHFPDKTKHLNSAWLAKRYGIRLRQRVSPSGGMYYWSEPIDPDGV